MKKEKEILGQPKRRIYFDEKCSFCVEQENKGNTFFPPHQASENCESGKYDHCTCDTCF